MNHARPAPDAIPTALHGLWSEACGWVSWLVSTFAVHPLTTTGVKRTTAARLTVWLSNIEGAVRRLILAAALALTPPAPRRHSQAAAPRTQPRTATRNASFHLLRLAGAATPTTPRSPSTAAPTPHAHIRFPRDPLLRLGVPPASSRTRALRTRNPLDRWTRLSRHDPDWRPSPNDGALMFSAPPEPQWRPQRAATSRAPLTPHDPNALPSSLLDWRRRHDEWQRLIPAPNLATRLEALARTIANPHALIARAARRLHRAHNLDPGLHAAAPHNRLPRRAANIETAGNTFDFNERAHSALVRHDSS